MREWYAKNLGLADHGQGAMLHWREKDNPQQERMMAKRAKARTVEINASHVAYISHPKETAQLIEEAATSTLVDQ